jgi:hypothetical protein
MNALDLRLVLIQKFGTGAVRFERTGLCQQANGF